MFHRRAQRTTSADVECRPSDSRYFTLPIKGYFTAGVEIRNEDLASDHGTIERPPAAPDILDPRAYEEAFPASLKKESMRYTSRDPSFHGHSASDLQRPMRARLECTDKTDRRSLLVANDHLYMMRQERDQDRRRSSLEEEWQLASALLIGVFCADATVLSFASDVFATTIVSLFVKVSIIIATLGLSISVYLQFKFRGVPKQRLEESASDIHANIYLVQCHLPLFLALVSLSGLSLVLIGASYLVSPMATITVAGIMATLAGLPLIVNVIGSMGAVRAA